MKDLKADDYRRILQLQPHPEGGYFKETYRDHRYTDFEMPGNTLAKRSFSTAIYFLIEKGNFSALHRIKSDEVWHFYAGDALEVVEIDERGEVIRTFVGENIEKGEVFQYVVKAGRWFGSRVAEGGSFSLVGCTVAPGFDFADFEMAERESLLKAFPRHEKIILALTR